MSLKFLFEIVAGNVIAKAITAPTPEQIEAEQQREWLIEKERILRAKSNAIASDLISSQKNCTPEKVMAIHQMVDEEVNKVLAADQQSLTYVSPSSNNAAQAIGRFVGGFVIGIFALIVLLAIFSSK